MCVTTVGIVTGTFRGVILAGFEFRGSVIDVSPTSTAATTTAVAVVVVPSTGTPASAPVIAAAGGVPPAAATTTTTAPPTSAATVVIVIATPGVVSTKARHDTEKTVGIERNNAIVRVRSRRLVLDSFVRSFFRLVSLCSRQVKHYLGTCVRKDGQGLWKTKQTANGTTTGVVEPYRTLVPCGVHGPRSVGQPTQVRVGGCPEESVQSSPPPHPTRSPPTLLNCARRIEGQTIATLRDDLPRGE